PTLNPSPQPPEAQPWQTPNLPTQPSRRKNRLIVVLLIVAGVSVLAAASYIFFSKSNNTDENLSATDMVGSGDTFQINPEKNTYRVYSNFDATTKQTTYTLVDETGGVVTTATTDAHLELLTPLGADKFLFIEKSPSNYYDEEGNNRYVLFGPEGFMRPTDLPESIRMLAVSGSFDNYNPKIASIGGTTVVFQYCKNFMEGKDSYQCDIRSVDVLSGEEKIMTQPVILNRYRAGLAAFSEDRKTLYFFGIYPENANTLEKKMNAITGGEFTTQDEEKMDEIYEKVDATVAVLALDLPSRTVTSKKDVKLKITHYGKYWLSPNGQHLVYSGGEQGELQYVNVEDGTTDVIKLPSPGQATEPWGGRTATTDPLFSPDGNYVAYVTYEPDKEYLGIIDLKLKTAKQYDERPLAQQRSDKNFSNLRWLDNTQLEYTRDGQNFRVVNGTGLANELDKTHGLLVGLADGAR
ncbi:PD40 domain-containing protein, partial [Candidatus Saccharibacteria bacterium]|nr:PD40 domain-containing protein [Candidatus Saccharibacteria bacterium]